VREELVSKKEKKKEKKGKREINKILSVDFILYELLIVIDCK
jgi:hypothetical protein